MRHWLDLDSKELLLLRHALIGDNSLESVLKKVERHVKVLQTNKDEYQSGTHS